MGKYTTDIKSEAKKNKDLIYLDRRVLNSIKIPVIKRCKECARILSDGIGRQWLEKGYCDLYCWEISNPPKQYTHFCNKCGEGVDSFVYTKDTGTHKKGAKTHLYPKYCKDCSPYHKKRYED
jgi:hypothetical protein